jgi:hypothetical protein
VSSARRPCRRCTGWALAGLLAVPACNYVVTDAEAPSRGADRHDAEGPGGPDGSRCEFKGRTDREVVESVSTGSTLQSIRRVFRVVGKGPDRRRILVCREVDTNDDGIKDVVRRYTERGDVFEELADTNYDGAIDTTMKFSKGRLAKVTLDLNRDDKPEETRYYQWGKVSRVQRDTNADGKPDIFEIYADGQLERMGVDVDFDGRVDRWNRDEVMVRAQREAEAAEAKAEEEAAAAKAKAAGSGEPEGAAGPRAKP